MVHRDAATHEVAQAQDLQGEGARRDGEPAGGHEAVGRLQVEEVDGEP